MNPTNPYLMQQKSLDDARDALIEAAHHLNHRNGRTPEDVANALLYTSIALLRISQGDFRGRALERVMDEVKAVRDAA